MRDKAGSLVFPTSAAMAVLLAYAAPAHAGFTLYIQNAGHEPVTMTLSSDNNNCYEGRVPLGQTFPNVAPGARITLPLSRRQGHGCNGHQGEFDVIFSPAVGEFKAQHFDFDNDGGLELTPNVPNAYPGQLSGRNADGSYVYTTFRPAAVTAGRAIGSWANICRQICNRSLAQSLTNEVTNEERQSYEVKNAIAVTLEAGVDMKGFSAKSSVTASVEKTEGHEMAQSFRRGETNTDTRNFVFTPEQMKALNIFAVWQWVATTDLSNGTSVVVRSNNFTCTQDDEPPNYAPGSPQDLKACKGGS